MFRSNLSLLPNIQSPTACFSVRIQACIQCLVRLLLCAGLLGWGAPRAAQAAEAPEETALSAFLFPETVSAGMALGADAYLTDSLSCRAMASLLSDLLYDPLDEDGWIA